MKKTPLYKRYSEDNKGTIGYIGLSNFGGLEVLDIEYGIEDYVVACFNWGTGRQQIRRHKICTTPSGRFFIWKNRTRYYFDQMMWGAAR